MINRSRQIISIGIAALLFCALLFGLGPSLSARLVLIGGNIWDGYAQDLRYDPEMPECELSTLQSRLKECPKDAPPVIQNDDVDPFADDVEVDPFADDEKDPFGEDPDPFADPEIDPFADDEEVDPFADDTDADPFADETEEDPFGDVTPAKPTAPCRELCALETLVERCAQRHATYTDIQSRITPSVQSYRTVELTFGAMAKFPYWKHMLILLTLLGATSVTFLREHIALRHVESLIEHRISQGLQLMVHVLWLLSCWNDYQVQQASSAATDHTGIPLIWCVGFAVLACVNLFHLIQPPSLSHHNKFSLARV